MKNSMFFLFIAIFIISPKLVAQTNYVKSFQKNSSNISIGHGIGNIWKGFLDKAITIPEYKVTSTGPFILIYEYGFSNRFSGGLQGSYSRVHGNSKRFQLEDQLTIISFLARANYHFLSTAKLDPYLGGGLGINNSKYVNNASVNVNNKVPSTFDYSGQLGIKYFPLKHFGAYLEAGYVGGSFVQVGITGKF